jgi:hypothetical protein
MAPPHEQILFVELPHEQILFMELPHEHILFVEPENQKKLEKNKKNKNIKKNNISGGPGALAGSGNPGPPEILFFCVFCFFLVSPSFFLVFGSKNRICSWSLPMNRFCSWSFPTNRFCSRSLALGTQDRK